tara:strand:+ start:139 stop:414 length:276 start_codon:yes stop_codon:yes gene_type:complete
MDENPLKIVDADSRPWLVRIRYPQVEKYSRNMDDNPPKMLTPFPGRGSCGFLPSGAEKYSINMKRTSPFVVFVDFVVRQHETRQAFTGAEA